VEGIENSVLKTKKSLKGELSGTAKPSVGEAIPRGGKDHEEALTGT